MAVTAEQVKRLRDRTGAGMADCKKALEEAEGNDELALDILRKRGAASAAKRADRQAKEGVIVTALSPDMKKAVIAEVNSETDFVARNESFIQFAQDIATSALTHSPNSQEEFMMVKLSTGISVAEAVGEQTGRIGEKIEARRFAALDGGDGHVVSYIHPGAKLGVLVAIGGNDRERATAVGRDVAMQVAAMNPMALDRSQIDAVTLEKEIDIIKTQLRNEGKKEEMIDKIATGKLEKFYQDNCLIEQSFIKDASKTIKEILKDSGDLSITGYIRMQLGEGQPILSEAEEAAIA
ncbi:MAG TPA: translation elongation factor Ts [Candidatus Kapabacteria bacterium]